MSISYIDGFICPKCGQVNKGIVHDSRFALYGKRRRRECEKCGERYTTIETCASRPLKFYRAFMEEKSNGNKKA